MSAASHLWTHRSFNSPEEALSALIANPLLEDSPGDGVITETITSTKEDVAVSTDRARNLKGASADISGYADRFCSFKELPSVEDDDRKDPLGDGVEHVSVVSPGRARSISVSSAMKKKGSHTMDLKDLIHRARSLNIGKSDGDVVADSTTPPHLAGDGASASPPSSRSYIVVKREKKKLLRGSSAGRRLRRGTSPASPKSRQDASKADGAAFASDNGSKEAPQTIELSSLSFSSTRSGGTSPTTSGALPSSSEFTGSLSAGEVKKSRNSSHRLMRKRHGVGGATSERRSGSNISRRLRNNKGAQDMEDHEEPTGHGWDRLSRPVVISPSLIEVEKAHGLLGSGAQGSVLRARYVGALVALKCFSFDKSSRIAQKAFFKEASTHARLSHPNVVQFMGVCPDRRWLVMEYVEGGSLCDFLHSSRASSLDGRLVRSILSGIARALAYLHSLSPPVVHRDMKSGNVLLGAGMVPKLCDFGSARQVSFDGRMTVNAGTMRWTAPEVFEGNAERGDDGDGVPHHAKQHSGAVGGGGETPVPAGNHYDTKVDVYSFAVIVWEVLSKKLPWETFRFNYMIEDAVRSGERLPIDEDWDQELVDIMKRCWVHCPSERPHIADLLPTMKQWENAEEEDDDPYRDDDDEAATPPPKVALDHKQGCEDNLPSTDGASEFLITPNPLISSKRDMGDDDVHDVHDDDDDDVHDVHDDDDDDVHDDDDLSSHENQDILIPQTSDTTFTNLTESTSSDFWGISDEN